MKTDDVMICSKKSKNGELLELIAWGRAELSRAGIEEAQEECERILIKLFSCSRSGIYLEEHELIASGVRERFLTILRKRLQRIPLAYLLNEADFWQETLYVDARCLIPRPETEILVEQILKAFGKDTEKSFSFLDIGTGSGAIAIAILRTFKNAQGTLLDISGEALEVARMNIEKYRINAPVIVRHKALDGSVLWRTRSPANSGATRQSVSKAGLLCSARNNNESRTRLVLGDLFGPFSNNEKWDLIVSNPPYLSEEDWKGVQEELKFEPKRALDGGKDGLDFYRKIISGAKDHLISGGLLAMEVGGQAGPPIDPAPRGLDAPSSQADKVSKWLQTAGYDNIQRFNDHLHIERVVTARRHS